ncbi:hypothetical protein A2U01_0077499, partial [Trifolium medium]|nr:hypothetical protein [Trifolium medium]
CRRHSDQRVNEGFMHAFAILSGFWLWVLYITPSVAKAMFGLMEYDGAEWNGVV